jgi:hypothetical protein
MNLLLLFVWKSAHCLLFYRIAEYDFNKKSSQNFFGMKQKLWLILSCWYENPVLGLKFSLWFSFHSLQWISKTGISYFYIFPISFFTFSYFLFRIFVLLHFHVSYLRVSYFCVSLIRTFVFCTFKTVTKQRKAKTPNCDSNNLVWNTKVQKKKKWNNESKKMRNMKVWNRKLQKYKT